ncbi:MAG TPA: stealth conserved region 3 domain-containing protein [Nocardioides sp.]|uniref:stealth conserved region 3 domain-containing protein n=1 Tax=Nocardioides sp. TaxID=35761 RepID=UPI002E340965|nr:stealth conserved region 3 domain-containing protein [Nocardioides sp.]HEX5090932.1 stealth conserved region 3 domain-containing protein [Nocardioides sp.]
MRISFLVQSAHKLGGTERSAVTQANALVAAGHDVRILSVVKAAEQPVFTIDERVRVEHLVDLTQDYDEQLHARESRLVPRRWDRQFSALTDVGLERGLRGLQTEVLVTVTPALLASALQLAPDPVVVVHQEHRSSSQRTSGLEPLLVNAPRADVVALLTTAMADWLRGQLGPVAPEIVSMPNPLPQGFAPRSLLDSRTIVAAGRLVMEKQFTKLVQAFAAVADQLPGWRLRILGQGHQRPHLVREIRKHGLWDRVELPGSTMDMRSEWARASISALTSRAEGFPLGLQEAMAAGVPCVSFDCASGPREIVRHEVNGLLVAPESIAGMSAALLRLGRDDDLRRRLGAGALDTAAAWEADKIAGQWVEILERAVARRAGRPRLAALAAAPEPAPPPVPSYDARGVTPAAARHAALSAAVTVAGRVSDEWLVVPPHETGTPVVVLPMAVRHRYLQELAAADVPAYLSLRDPAANGWPERRAPVPGLASDLLRGRTSSVALEPWPIDGGSAALLGQGCSVEVEFWEEDVDGQLVAPTRNRYTQRLPRTAARVTTEVEGLRVPTLPLMAAPTVHECTFPVDVVYTWVDGRDPAWNQARLDRLSALTGTATTRESSGQARFVSRDELRYSLRSVHLFAPWVRKIHLVTAGQVPEWLDQSHPQVEVVDHSAILPPDALPTFNSHAIESALHRLPDLAEHFVYLNDDFFLGRPLGPETFFSPAGLAAVWFSPNTVGLDDTPGAAPYLKAAWNNRRLLQKAFGAVLTDNLAHAPYPHRRSVLEEIERRFPAEVAATARSPFRSDTDLSMLSSFAQHYGLLTGRAYAAHHPDQAERAYINIANSDLEWQLTKVLERQQDFLCLADHHDHALNQERLDRTLTEFMAAYFPVAAPWERGN